MSLVREVEIHPRSPAGFERVLGADSIRELERAVIRIRQRLDGRVIWNVNSTAAGGGVAELLHSLLAYARGLGVDTRWLVIGGSPEFFRITKRIHNAMHGERGDGSDLGKAERVPYERVAEDNASELCRSVRAGDFVILHDPQTAGLISPLRGIGARVVWRCHIGADEPSREVDLAWRFLAPYLEQADGFVFSRFAYIPPVCDHQRSVIVPPTIDPFAPKNEDLDEATVRAILVQTGLVAGRATGAPEFLLEDGSPCRVVRRAEVVREGEPPPWSTPQVVQVSRWDRLKDPVGVLRGFDAGLDRSDLAGAHLTLAGPDVRSVADDPEGEEVFQDVVAAWRALPDERRQRVHLANLPMTDLDENAAMVNALQRHAAVVVQKSLREGFGLTLTEAMWKARPVIASAVGGLQDQVEHGVSGLLLSDPSDLQAFASALDLLLGDRDLAERLGRKARQRTSQLYLGLRSLTRYADLIERFDR
jgi:trehalose synthase